MDWTDLAQDRDQWGALVNTIMNFQVPKNVKEFLSLLNTLAAVTHGTTMAGIALCAVVSCDTLYVNYELILVTIRNSR
jgi:hypothetical protein